MRRRLPLRRILAPGLLALAASLSATGGALATAETAPASLDVLVERRGERQRVSVSGTLPTGLRPGNLIGRLPGLLGIGDVGTGGTGDPRAWLRAVEAINVVLPRISSARIRIEGGTIAFRGRLMPGISLKETRPAMRSALGQEWRLDFALEEAPPPAAIRILRGPQGTTVSGILPSGLSVRQACAALGDAEADGLTSGGTGDVAAWSRRLTRLGTLLRTYERAEVTLEPDRLSVAGRLAPGQARARVLAWAEPRFPDAGTVAIDGEETPAADGTRRFDPATRSWERKTDGRWVPVFDFAPGPEACTRALARLSAGADFAFATGATEPGERAAPLLDRIAALMDHCGGLDDRRLLIGGHTDSVGDPDENLPLSQARAEAVAAALAARGADPGRLLAVGYGSGRPVADNETREGRARNRRISLDWVAPARSDPLGPVGALPLPD